jgi:hypothetical protein
MSEDLVGQPILAAAGFQPAPGVPTFSDACDVVGQMSADVLKILSSVKGPINNRPQVKQPAPHGGKPQTVQASLHWTQKMPAAGCLTIRRRLPTCPTNLRGARRNKWIVEHKHRFTFGQVVAHE